VNSFDDSLVRTLTERVVHQAGQPGEGHLDSIIRTEVARYSEALIGEGGWGDADEARITREVASSVSGLGPLQKFLDDPDIEEIWINAPDAIFVARLGVSQKVDVELSAEEVRDLVERMLRPTGRRVDVSQPFVDASLADGSRVHVLIPDITKSHWSINIRKFSKRVRNLSDLVEREVLSGEAADFLTQAVRSGRTILVSGATQAGKTTMLQTLLREAPPAERVVSVEETFELDLAIPDHVGLQCRGPSLEGTGEVTLRRLVKEALRMRPDRIVVGEVREAEALDLLIALNSGLPGACTIHARSGPDALGKLCTLPLLAGGNIDRSFVAPTVASVIDLVVHVELLSTGARQVREIVSPTGVDGSGDVTSHAIFTRREGKLEKVSQSWED